LPRSTTDADSSIAIAVVAVVAAVTGAIVATRLYSDAGQWARLGLTVATFWMFIDLLYGSGQLFWTRVVRVSAAIKSDHPR